nr:uncharacterized protein LOC105488886 [Macaca nemestrina]
MTAGPAASTKILWSQWTDQGSPDQTASEPDPGVSAPCSGVWNTGYTCLLNNRGEQDAGVQGRYQRPGGSACRGSLGFRHGAMQSAFGVDGLQSNIQTVLINKGNYGVDSCRDPLRVQLTHRSLNHPIQTYLAGSPEFPREPATHRCQISIAEVGLAARLVKTSERGCRFDSSSPDTALGSSPGPRAGNTCNCPGEGNGRKRMAQEAPTAPHPPPFSPVSPDFELTFRWNPSSRRALGRELSLSMIHSYFQKEKTKI